MYHKKTVPYITKSIDWVENGKYCEHIANACSNLLLMWGCSFKNMLVMSGKSIVNTDLMMLNRVNNIVSKLLS